MESFLTPYGLSNSGQEKLQFTPFWGGPKLVCSDGLRAGTMESYNFFVLGPILVKFHIRTCLIESFRTIYWTWWCGEEKLHFTPVHTLHQLKRDEALFPPLKRVRGLSEVRLENCTQVWGVGQIWRASDSRLMKNSTSHLAWLVQTCLAAQYSDHVRSSRNVIFCTFERSYSSVLRPILLKLDIWTRLIERFPLVYGLWSCIGIEMSNRLGAHAWRPSTERGSSALTF